MKNESLPTRRGLGRGARRAALALVAGGALLAMAPAVSADGASVLSDVQCDPSGDGVVDLTLVNDGAGTAVFVVSGATYEVEPGSAHALSFSGLADGPFTVPASVDGVDATVSATVECDAPRVEVLAPVAAEEPTLPSTGGEVGWGLVIGGVLVGAGVAASLVARRHYG